MHPEIKTEFPETACFFAKAGIGTQTEFPVCQNVKSALRKVPWAPSEVKRREIHRPFDPRAPRCSGRGPNPTEGIGTKTEFPKTECSSRSAPGPGSAWQSATSRLCYLLVKFGFPSKSISKSHFLLISQCRHCRSDSRGQRYFPVVGFPIVLVIPKRSFRPLRQISIPIDGSLRAASAST